MQMRPEIQIQSVLKAMTDVVLPALDPTNKLAQEQARLCMGLLALLGQQLPVQFKFDCEELTRLIALSHTLATEAKDDACAATSLTALSAATHSASQVLERAKADPSEVRDSVRSLRATTSAVVQAVYADPAAQSVAAIQRTVLACSKAQLLRDRSMLLMQNWEADPKAIPPLQQLLDHKGAA